MSNLPSEIITEILLRLPVKIILRCRCVSKPWCSLIDGPDFIRLQINYSSETSSNLSIIVNDFRLYTIDGFDNEVLHEATELNHPLMCYNHSIKVLGSCDGLLFISNVVDDMALWNLSTRKHHVVPYLPLELNRYFGACLCSLSVFGFGYDFVSDDYKVVRIAQFTGIERQSFESEVKVYCLRKNLWRRVGDMSYCIRNPGANGVFASGALHWVASENPISNVVNRIVAFHLDVEEFRELPKPEAVDEKFQIEVAVLRGRLCLLAKFKFERVDVWVMNEYGLKESWIKLFSIEHREVVGNLRSLRPLVYSKSGNEVLMEHDNIDMFWYDLRKKQVKNVRIPNVPVTHRAEVCFNSLVSLSPNRPFIGRIQNKHEETSNGKMKDDFLSEGFKLVL